MVYKEVHISNVGVSEELTTIYSFSKSYAFVYGYMPL